MFFSFSFVSQLEYAQAGYANIIMLMLWEKYISLSPLSVCLSFLFSQSSCFNFYSIPSPFRSSLSSRLFHNFFFCLKQKSKKYTRGKKSLWDNFLPIFINFRYIKMILISNLKTEQTNWINFLLQIIFSSARFYKPSM